MMELDSRSSNWEESSMSRSTESALRQQLFEPQLLNYGPATLWEQFYALAAMPRPSGQEQDVGEYVRQLALDKGIEPRIDAAGNIVVPIPGCGRGAGAAPVAVQAHMDMVCVADPERPHDSATTPLTLELTAGAEGPGLKAKGTTLGADNRGGMSAMLALMLDGSLTDLPPLELVFTADEEAGCTGAAGLPAEHIKARQIQGVTAYVDRERSFVRTSNNLGQLHTSPQIIELVMLSRSSNSSELHALQELLASVLAASGAEVHLGIESPGWEADAGQQQPRSLRGMPYFEHPESARGRWNSLYLPAFIEKKADS